MQFIPNFALSDLVISHVNLCAMDCTMCSALYHQISFGVVL